ncbi:hypothetical protein MPSEU_000460400 [Mayamaea pseudoterrestris]|nr:hypothetical protein MPSEU_000460400 [Mayamaea pseudoterrestris]
MEQDSVSIPGPDWTLLSQGAEARVWKVPNYGGKVVVVAKERFSKKYRHVVLDDRLTRQRCRAEAKLLEKCAKGNLRVPKVLRVQAPILYLEYLGDEVITLRERLQVLLHTAVNHDDDDNDDTASKAASSSDAERMVLALARSLGLVLAKLNNLGIVHGDLTSSNMMVHRHAPSSMMDESELDETNDNNAVIMLIDFGLAKNSTSAEERAVDLYVLERALVSTHPKLPPQFLEKVIDVYRVKANGSEATLARLEQVRMRGRKRECFG